VTNGTHEQDLATSGLGDAPRGAPTRGTSTTTVAIQRRPLLIRDLSWSDAEITDTSHRLHPLEPDWDTPGMDAYDDL